MGTQRTSNKDILEAINAQTEAIGKLVSALSVTTTPEVNSAPTVTVEQDEIPSTVKVDEGYLNHMKGKVQDACNEDGNDRILYARQNKQNQTKLGYCLADRWTNLSDKRIIGAVDHITPNS